MSASAQSNRLEVLTAEEAICCLWLYVNDGAPAEHVANLCGVKRLSAKGLS